MNIDRSWYGLIALAALSCMQGCAREAESSASSAAKPVAAKPPVAAERPHAVESPNGSRNDEYYWLRDDTRTNKEMLAHLAAENAYTDAVLGHTKPLQEKLYTEIVGRIKQDDASVPYRDRGYWYYSRFETGKEYPIYAR